MPGNPLLKISSLSWSHFQLQNIEKTTPTNTKKMEKTHEQQQLQWWCYYKVRNIIFLKMNEYIELECTRMKELGHATKRLRKLEHATKSM